MVVEGLFSAIAGVVDVPEPAVEFFLRANASSLVSAVGASTAAASENGSGAFSGPYIGWGQAVVTLVVYAGVFVAVAAWSLRRRDVV